jgi:hypothetical protein
MSFEIAWHFSAKKLSRTVRFSTQCVLLERTLIGGRPAFKTAACLASIGEDDINDEFARDKFWAIARKRLGKLTRLRDRDRSAIEDQIALKIPKPMPSAYALTARPSANPIRGPHQPLTGLALRAR